MLIKYWKRCWRSALMERNVQRYLLRARLLVWFVGESDLRQWSGSVGKTCVRSKEGRGREK
jgi:hypothetical protein